MKPSYAFERTSSGHRLGYLEYFAETINGRKCLGRLSPAQALGARLLVLSTADDYLPAAVACALVRALLGRPTLLVLIRAELTLGSRVFKHRVKRALLTLALRFRRVTTISTMPFFVEPGLAQLVRTWIYDPAFFARNACAEHETETAAEQAFFAELDQAGPRRLVLFLGALSVERGIDRFFDLAQTLAGPAGDCLPVAAGRGAGYSPEGAQAYVGRGGKLYVGRLSEQGFDRLLARAALLWCCFNDTYDQFSGLFCNAYRRGLPCVVRRGSRLARFSAAVDADIKSLSGGTGIIIMRTAHDSVESFRHHNNATVTCSIG